MIMNYAVLSVFVVIVAITLQIQAKINESAPNQYMDEIFHINMTQIYFQGIGHTYDHIRDDH